MRKLTPKQARFISEYLIDLNATQAARRAGYSPRSAASIGHENLRKPEIRVVLNARIMDRESRTAVSQDKVLQELSEVAFFDPRKLFREDGTIRALSELSRIEAACIVSLEVLNGGKSYRLKLANKTNALEALANHLGTKD